MSSPSRLGLQYVPALIRSRVCRRVTLAVLVSIVLIEAAIFGMAYRAEHQELYGALESEAERTVNAILSVYSPTEEPVMFNETAETKMPDAMIAGMAVYSEAGEPIAEVGEGAATAPLSGDVDGSVPSGRAETVLQIDGFGEQYLVAVRLDTTAIDAELWTFLTNVVGIVLLIVVFVTAATMVALARTVLVPLMRVHSYLETAGHDLDAADDATLPTDRRHEVGDVARAVAQLTAKSREAEALRRDREAMREQGETERREMVQRVADDFEAKVKSVADAVAKAAAEMRSAAEGMAGTAEQANGRSGEAASASEQANSRVQAVASAAEELAQSISTIAGRVGDAQKVTGEAVTSAESMNETIEELSKRSERIGEVVELISDIAGRARRRGRQGLRGGGRRGQGPGHPDLARHPGHRRADRRDPVRDAPDHRRHRHRARCHRPGRGDLALDRRGGRGAERGHRRDLAQCPGYGREHPRRLGCHHGTARRVGPHGPECRRGAGCRRGGVAPGRQPARRGRGIPERGPRGLAGALFGRAWSCPAQSKCRHPDRRRAAP